MKKFKKRYIPLMLLVLILGCNVAGWGDMNTSEKKINQRFNEANIKNYSTGFVQREGLKIFFAQASNVELVDTAPVFIFAHGTPGALANSMAYLLDSTLLNIGTVVAYDRPGFGLSSHGDGWLNLDAQVAGLEMLKDKYVGHKIYLVGHSYGAPVILQTAMDYPEKVAGLVWLGGVVQTAWKAHAWWRKPMNYPPIKWLVPSSMVVSNKEIINLEADLEKIKDRWGEVTCPVVMIQGSEDWLAEASNTEYADSMLVESKDKKVIMVEDKSHFFYFSEPHYVVDALVGFLALGE